MHRCINLTAGAVARFENPENGMDEDFWRRLFFSYFYQKLEGLESNSPPGSDGPSLNWHRLLGFSRPWLEKAVRTGLSLVIKTVQISVDLKN